MATPIEISGTGKVIGGDDVFVIADIGKNFIQTEEDRPQEEYIENAKKLVDAAIEAGVDAVKFQTHVLEDEFPPGLDVTSPHFKGKDRYSWIKRNEEATPLSFWKELKAHTEKQGGLFFSTPMSRMAAEKLDAVGVPFWKLGSGDITDYATMDYIAGTGKPLIVSTGMVSHAELEQVVAHIRSKGIPLAVLYCISKYPCPPEHFNLGSIEYLQEKYPDVAIGFSDHSVDSHEVDLAAVKLGAKIVEKHFTFSRDLWGADHKASLTPEETKQMVADIRAKKHESVDAAKYYGEKEKEFEGAENQFRPYFHKALVAGADIPQGTVLTEKMIFSMRPKMYIKGLPADRFDEVVGKTVAKGLKKYEPIKEEHLAVDL